MRTSPLTLDDLHPVPKRLILQHLPIADITMWGQTNRFWRKTCRDYVRLKFTSVLARYISDVEAFRELMRATVAVVAGAEAINFALHGCDAPLIFPHELTIHVGALHAMRLVEYIRDHEDYHVEPIDDCPRTPSIYDDNHGRVTTLNMVHRERCTRIQVTCCSRLTPLFTIVQSWSTAHMTFLTADVLVVAYPTLTFAGVLLLCNVDIGAILRENRVKAYRLRGFQVLDFDCNRVRVLGFIFTSISLV